MMNRKLGRALAAGALAAAGLLAACGGGSDGPSATTQAQSLASDFSASLSAMASASGIASAALLDLFAAGYLDAGLTKDQLTAALQADAAAAGANVDFSLFPLATLTDATLADCDTAGLCTLTGTLTNADADTTSIPFSAKVQRTGTTLRFVGDQKTS